MTDTRKDGETIYRLGDVQMTAGEFGPLKAALDRGECLYCGRTGLTNRYGSARRHRNACGRRLDRLGKEKVFAAYLAPKTAPRVVAECWTCQRPPHECPECHSKSYPLHVPGCQYTVNGTPGVPLSLSNAKRVKQHRTAGHDVRPVQKGA